VFEQPGAKAAYREAAVLLDGSGMPGLERGLLPLALLSLNGSPAGGDWGPYEPWVRPLALLAEGRRAEAAEALGETPDPPGDLLLEAMWCLTARAAIALGNRPVMQRAAAALEPAARELAGAGSGLVAFGPVSRQLDELAAALR
jgi:hypothetical protein